MIVLIKENAVKKMKKLKKYNLYRSCELIFSTNSKKKLEKAMGEMLSIYSVYEVLDENGQYIPEYIPF